MPTDTLCIDIDMYTWAKIVSAAARAGVSPSDYAAQIVEETVARIFLAVGSTNPLLPTGFNQPA